MGDKDNKSVFSVVIQVFSLNKTERYNIANVVNCVLFMYACMLQTVLLAECRHHLHNTKG
jgi:hypothetical protein